MNSGPVWKLVRLSDCLAFTNGQLSSLDALFDEGQLCSAVCLVRRVDWQDFVPQILLLLSPALKMEIEDDRSQGYEAIQDIFDERFERHHLLLIRTDQMTCWPISTCLLCNLHTMRNVQR